MLSEYKTEISSAEELPVFLARQFILDPFLPRKYDDLLSFNSKKQEDEFVFSSEGTEDLTEYQSPTEASNVMPDSIRDNWSSLAKSQLSSASVKKLTSLASKNDGWRGPGSKGLDSGSLRTFLEFWSDISENSLEPFITLSPNGNLYAEWRASVRRVLDVEFTNSGDVYFGLLHNNTEIDGKDKWRDLIGILVNRPQNPFSWRRA